MASIISRSPGETFAYGESVAAELKPGAVLALRGDLGAGKTHFVKGVAAGLGASPDDVTSPTFTLVHEYIGGRLPVFHFDLYRLEDADEVLRIGLDDYLSEDGVVVIEWADKFPELLPDATRWLHFRVLEGDEREITEA
ncbi:MAG: tRNA (adenosine(37)-N6)-threonylcarbamoyltransferase complex ATPase subunit type 1 TsaE [Chthoniobacteraceae bacterium]